MDEITPASRERVVLLWGSSQTGKTSLLTAALFGKRDEIDALDIAASSRELTARLQGHWAQLRRGQFVSATIEDRINLTLQLKTGQRVQCRDIRGGTTDTEGVADAQLLDQHLEHVAAVLFLLDFQAEDMQRQVLAIEAVLPRVAHLPIGLVFTKCEMLLDANGPEWRAEEDWWRAHDHLRHNQNVLGGFGRNIWPTSVFGYQSGTQFAAVTLGEFGELRPFGISPVGVTAPFRWALAHAAGDRS